MPKAKDTALILVLNAGSSSIKFAVFDTDLRQEIDGIVEGIGGASTIKIADQSRALPFIDHKSALSGILSALAEHNYGLERFSAGSAPGGSRRAQADRPGPPYPGYPR